MRPTCRDETSKPYDLGGARLEAPAVHVPLYAARLPTVRAATFGDLTKSRRQERQHGLDCGLSSSPGKRPHLWPYSVPSALAKIPVMPSSP